MSSSDSEAEYQTGNARFDEFLEYLDMLLRDVEGMIVRTPEDVEEALRSYEALGWASTKLKYECEEMYGTPVWQTARNECCNLQLEVYNMLCDLTDSQDRDEYGRPARFACPAFRVPVVGQSPTLLAPRMRTKLAEEFLIDASQLGMPMSEMARAATDTSGIKVSAAVVTRAFAGYGLEKPARTSAKTYREKVDNIVREQIDHVGLTDPYEMYEKLRLKDHVFLPVTTIFASYKRVCMEEIPKE
ncbi:hypothetical protein JCM10908_000297 [Rhodotorula pacifica]|uniref:uncharacterized protein n=1 Tax=Rhodotorula pacifica TaxID=1495444 RepID=UPI00317DB62C